jgi:LPXTG-motif cell wall-anchored protein
VRALLVLLMRLYFRMHIAGAEHIPGEGPAIVRPTTRASSIRSSSRPARAGSCASWPRPEVAGELVEESLWPQVEGEYRRLRARPTLIAAGLAALGLAGGLLLRRRRR